MPTSTLPWLTVGSGHVVVSHWHTQLHSCRKADEREWRGAFLFLQPPSCPPEDNLSVDTSNWPCTSVSCAKFRCQKSNSFSDWPRPAPRWGLRGAGMGALPHSLSDAVPVDGNWDSSNWACKATQFVKQWTGNKGRALYLRNKNLYK